MLRAFSLPRSGRPARRPGARRRARRCASSPMQFRLADGSDARRRARHLHGPRGPQRSRARAGSRSASSASARPMPQSRRADRLSRRRAGRLRSRHRARAAPAGLPRTARGRRRDRARPARRRPLQPYPALHGRTAARSGRRCSPKPRSPLIIARRCAPAWRAGGGRGRGARLHDRAERRRSRGSAARARRAPDRPVGHFLRHPSRLRDDAPPSALDRPGRARLGRGHGPDGQAARSCRLRLRAGSTRLWAAGWPSGCAGSMPASTPQPQAFAAPRRQASAPIPSRSG